MITDWQSYAGSFQNGTQGVVSDDGKQLCFQMGRSGDEAGVGYEFFVMDLEAAAIFMIGMVIAAAQVARGMDEQPSLDQLLSSHCLDCHNSDTTEGELDLDDFRGRPVTRRPGETAGKHAPTCLCRRNAAGGRRIAVQARIDEPARLIDGGSQPPR